jgi:hypothetical protein
MITVVGYDPNGTRRVYGEGPSLDVAETRCMEEAIAYLRRRPDTGPLSRWLFREPGNLPPRQLQARTQHPRS